MPIPQDKATLLLENQLQLIQGTQAIALNYIQGELVRVEDLHNFAEAINAFTIGYDKILFGDVKMSLNNTELQFVLDLISNSNETKTKLAELESANTEIARLLAEAQSDDAIDEQVKADLQAQLDAANALIAELQSTTASNNAQSEQIRQAILAEQAEVGGGVVQPAPVEPTV